MPVGDQPITLFQGGSSGFGDAINVGRDSYAWSVNWDCRPLGRAVPAIAPIKLTPVNTIFLNPVTAAFEWETDATPPVPFLLMLNGSGSAIARTSKLLDGAITNEDDQTIDPYTDGVLFRFDQDATEDADEEMVFMCNGSANDIFVRRKKDATIDTGSTTPHTAKADHLGVVGGDLWLSDGYLMRKLTLNTDPGILTNYGVAIPVGRPTWPVNKIVDLGGSPFALCGDGVFRYNPAPSAARFDNITPFVSPHPDNGKAGFTDGRGRIYYDTVDGYILVLSFGSQNLQRPARFNFIDRDTPWGRITAMTADIEYVYAAVDPGAVRSHAITGLVGVDTAVKKFDSPTYTNHGDNVTDQDFSTDMDVTALTLNDFIYIGADEPFWGIHFELSATRTSLGTAFTTSYSTASGFSAFSTTHDGTNAFSHDGTWSFSETGFTDVVDADATTPWVTREVDGETKYWVQLAPGAVLTGAKIREIRLIPYRPSIDPDLWPITGYAQAGAMPKILVGTWQGETILWHDVWTLRSARIDQLVVSRTAAPEVTGQRTLFAIAPDAVHYMPVGPDADPVRAAWPKLADYSDSGSVAMDEHVLGFSGPHFDLPVNVKSVQKLVIHGEFLQADDEFWVYHRWDNGDRWHNDGAYSSFPVVIDDLADTGRVLHVAVQFKDGSRDAIAPYITHAIIPAGEWEDLGPLHEAIGADIASPQAV